MKGAPGQGRAWAYAGAFVGGTVSVAANIAHSYRPPDGAGAGWSPQPGAVILAGFWPAALLLAIEVMARVQWPDDTRWTVVRYGGVTPVALVAAVVSYRHLSGLLDWYGDDRVTVLLGPLAVDGLMVVSTGALLALATHLPTHSAVDPAAHPIAEEPPIRVDGSADGMAWLADGQPPVERMGEEAAAAAPAPALHLVGEAPPVTTKRSANQARAADITRAEQAIKDGRLQHPLTADAIKHELNIGLQHARAVRDTLSQSSASQ